MNKSLKFKLVLPYVLLILLLTMILGWLSWWANSRTVASLSTQLMSEMTQRIAQAVDRHMFGTGAVLETAFPDGMRAPEDIGPQQSELITRFYTAASIFTDPSDYVYYGNEAGQGIGVQKLVDGSAQIRLKLDAKLPRDFYLINGINGVPEYRFGESTVFDPRSRVWYQLGRDAAHHTWTAVYLDYGTSQLVVTRARKVLNGAGQFAGVVATDLFLSELSRFVRQLPVSAAGRAFIIETNGQLIAASSVDNVRTDEQGNIVRVSAVDSGDELIEQSWLSLREMLQSLDFTGQQVQQLSFTQRSGERVHLSVKQLRDNAGLDWYAVVAVPSADILGGVRSNTIMVVGIGMLALLLAQVLGWIIFGRVASDIAQLSAAVKGAGRDLTDISAQAGRSDEIGTLASSFIQMRRELFTDSLTGVGNRMALEYRLQDLLLARRIGQQPFAVLFLDLNRFKQLNDTFGHDKGDLALIESARRIESMLGDTDLLVRLGGDEFVIILPEAGPGEELDRFCQQLQQLIAQPLECCEDYCLGAAIGVALYPQHGDCKRSLLKHADNEMYAAKEKSR